MTNWTLQTRPLQSYLPLDTGLGADTRRLSAVACTDFLKGKGEKKGTLARVLAPKRALKDKFCLPKGHFSACFGPQEGTEAQVLAPKRAL